MGELTKLTGQRQSLVSYHLGRLHGAALVSMRRSSADGRDMYYSLDLGRCGEALAETGAALHPALRLVASEDRTGAGSGERARVLFLCTGNSARSQMAEAFANRLGGDVVEAYSAGSRPKQVYAETVRVMREHGFDLSNSRAKHLDEFAHQRFDYVISLCDRVREVCPEFPGQPALIHWSIADPAVEAETQTAFRRTASEIEKRVRFLLPLVQASNVHNKEVASDAR